VTIGGSHSVVIVPRRRQLLEVVSFSFGVLCARVTSVLHVVKVAFLGHGARTLRLNGNTCPGSDELVGKRLSVKLWFEGLQIDELQRRTKAGPEEREYPDEQQAREEAGARLVSEVVLGSGKAAGILEREQDA